jgi:SAM-dependent methyltransferase
VALVLSIMLEPWTPDRAEPIAHGAIAAAAGHAFGLPGWWLPLNFCFVPAALWLHGLALAPAWFLGAFVVLALLFWNTHRTRVPLFLSSGQACEALAELVPRGSAVRVVDLGCGLGDVVRRLAPRKPDAAFVGFELAPLPAALAWLRTRAHPNACVLRRDFWNEDLGGYDLVYAFLSPAAMPDLWRKARAEMKPGALLVSNSFTVPGVEPDCVVPLAGRGSRALYLWRL